MTNQPSELIHALVLREMQDGILRDGLWAQAMSDVGSDIAKAKALYIRLRAASMQEETKQLLVKQIQTGVKEALKPNKDFLSAMDLKKTR
ncbi:MAG: hypothetical protein EBZ60_00330 [Betaproteobacteria bacterium]|nr:hypothetical protein [Betaproteobacteria bacterium]